MLFKHLTKKNWNVRAHPLGHSHVQRHTHTRTQTHALEPKYKNWETYTSTPVTMSIQQCFNNFYKYCFLSYSSLFISIFVHNFEITFLNHWYYFICYFSSYSSHVSSGPHDEPAKSMIFFSFFDFLLIFLIFQAELLRKKNEVFNSIFLQLYVHSGMLWLGLTWIIIVYAIILHFIYIYIFIFACTRCSLQFLSLRFVSYFYLFFF